MLLVEVWRVQRGLGWYVLGVIVLALMAISIGHNASLTVNDKNELAQLGVAASALIPLPLVTACGFATFVGAALVAQNDVLDLAWTKPIPREVIALRIIAVDLVAVAGAFVFGLGAVFAVGLLVHVTPHLDPAFPSALLLGLGVALMWCALTLALTARLRRGGWVGGVMWPVPSCASAWPKSAGRSARSAVRSISSIRWPILAGRASRIPVRSPSIQSSVSRSKSAR